MTHDEQDEARARYVVRGVVAAFLVHATVVNGERVPHEERVKGCVELADELLKQLGPVP